MGSGEGIKFRAPKVNGMMWSANTTFASGVGSTPCFKAEKCKERHQRTKEVESRYLHLLPSEMKDRISWKSVDCAHKLLKVMIFKKHNIVTRTLTWSVVMHGLFNCQPLSPARSHPWRLLFAGPTGNAVFAGVAIGLYVKSGYNEVRILDQIMPWAFASAVGLQHLTSSSFVQTELFPGYVWLPFEVLAFQRETILIVMPIIPSSPNPFPLRFLAQAISFHFGRH